LHTQLLSQQNAPVVGDEHISKGAYYFDAKTQEGPPALLPTPGLSAFLFTGQGWSYLSRKERPFLRSEITAFPPSFTLLPLLILLLSVWQFNSLSDEPFLSPFQLYSLPRGSLVVRGAVACTLLAAANLSRGQLSFFFFHCNDS
jgi:hypothetical protein